MKTQYYIGCSSYATPSWQPHFYPDALPKKNGLTIIAGILKRMNSMVRFIDFQT